jgi:hypothetical protein
MASGQGVPHQQVEHMAAPTSAAEPFNSSLPKESRPHMARSGLRRRTARRVRLDASLPSQCPKKCTARVRTTQLELERHRTLSVSEIECHRMRPSRSRVRLPYITGPNGNVLTIADLPSRKTRRWVRRRKAEVVLAVEGGLLSLDEACRRYDLTVEEFSSWQCALQNRQK